MTLADRHRIAQEAGLVTADSPSHERHNAALWVAEVLAGKRVHHLTTEQHERIRALANATPREA